jgi:hypothetical protein
MQNHLYNDLIFLIIKNITRTIAFCLDCFAILPAFFFGWLGAVTLLNLEMKLKFK